MPTLKLPSAGKTASDAAVLRWRKREGDIIASGETLLEAEANDGLIEVTSPSAGRLIRILAPAGKTVAVGGVVAEIGPTEASAASSSSQQDAKAPAMTSTSSKPSGPVTPVLMPKAGQSMEEGVIVAW